MRSRTLFERLPDREAETACGLRMEVGLAGGTLSEALCSNNHCYRHNT